MMLNTYLLLSGRDTAYLRRDDDENSSPSTSINLLQYEVQPMQAQAAVRNPHVC
jgi:hypothetical protein